MVRRIARAVPVLVVVLAGLAGLAGCSQTATTTDPAAAPAPAGGVVIAQIVTHDAKVAILGSSRSSQSAQSSSSAERELRVVVQKLDGTMVADGITLDDLRARDPELYVVVTSAFASNGSYVDATLDLGHIN